MASPDAIPLPLVIRQDAALVLGGTSAALTFMSQPAKEAPLLFETGKSKDSFQSTRDLGDIAIDKFAHKAGCRGPMYQHTDSNEMNVLIARLSDLYNRVIQDGLPDTLSELLTRPESQEMRSIGNRLIEIEGLDIMLEIGHRIYPRNDELAFTCNILLSVIFELPFDFSKGFWVMGLDHKPQRLAS